MSISLQALLPSDSLNLALSLSQVARFSFAKTLESYNFDIPWHIVIVNRLLLNHSFHYVLGLSTMSSKKFQAKLLGVKICEG
jgi:hypothetical protein